MAIEALCIAGATATGKSAFATALAVRLNGVIINADSMQVYKDLDVLSARPDVTDLARVPHFLYGHIDASHAYSTAQWAAEAEEAFLEARSAGKTALFVGGTGLYFKAATQGLIDMPAIDTDVRSEVRALVKDGGSEAAHAELAAVDPEMAARLNPADRQRVARALEVVRSTGRSLAHWQAETQPGFLAPLFASARATGLVINWPREMLYSRSDTRFDIMLEAGALEEVRALAARKLNPDLPAMKALGVPALSDFIAGRIGREEAATLAKQQTRNFIKRQLTWFRNQFADWKRIEGRYMEAETDAVLADLGY